ncbi:hypothetical protein [Streptomyces sp. NPDC057686]|uniref:hypothetical protein n=1 Tax=Streptomyces sp. NPDC057686 TaxID=3346212 RepID=UPI0036B3C86B
MLSTPQAFGALTVCFWDPSDGSVPDDSWYSLVLVGYEGIQIAGIPILVKETDPDPNNPLLAPPVRFDQLTDTLWRPVAPDGYVAFSDVFEPDGADPSSNGDVRWCMCLRAGQQSDGHTYVSTNAPVESEGPYGGWRITAPQYTGDPDGILLTTAGAFVYSPDVEPVDTPVQNLLNLPPVIVTGPPPAPPTMDSFDEPVGQTVPSVDRTVLVPFLAIQDGTGIKWQLAHSPYYTIIRQRSYTLALFGNNQGDIPQSQSKALTYGVSDTESQTFSASVGVTVGFEAGVDIFVAEAKVSASLTVTLGYASSTSVTDMESETVTQTLVVEPKTAGAMYNETHTIDVHRQDGSEASVTGPLTFEAYSSVYYVSYDGSSSQRRREPVRAHEPSLTLPGT